MTQCPAIERQYFDEAMASKLQSGDAAMPRILILYGSFGKYPPLRTGHYRLALTEIDKGQ